MSAPKAGKVNGEPDTSRNLERVLHAIVKNQQTLATSMQSFMTEMSNNFADLRQKIETLEEQINELADQYETEKTCINTISDDVRQTQANVEKVLDSIVEMDVREQNRRLRKKEAFSFQPRRNANI